MRRIFVYEYLSGGGNVGSEAEAEQLLPLGVSMRDAIIADLLGMDDIAVTCGECLRPGAGLPDSRGALTPAMPRPGETPPAYVARMACSHDFAWIVAPESDGLLQQLHEAVGAARWIGCNADAIRVASSKRATLRALARVNVSTPLAFQPADVTRWIVKPDDGAGACDTLVHADLASAEADLATRLREHRSATLEPYVEGEALSVSMLAGPGFVQPLSFNRQDIAIAPDGVVHYRGVRSNALDMRTDPRASQLHTLALDVARAVPGLRGFVGFDLVWHAQRGPVVIEVNPRVTCAYAGLSAALGRNLAEEILLLQCLPETVDAGA